MRAVRVEKLVEGGDGVVDVLALKDVRGEEPEDGIGCVRLMMMRLGAWHFGERSVGKVGGGRVRADHEAFAADFEDGVVLRAVRVRLSWAR